MRLLIDPGTLRRIHTHGEEAYPHEGAGFLLGREEGGTRWVLDIFPVDNERQGEEARRRYLLGPEEMLRAETAATRQGLQLLGVFHSHPDHPNQPSEFDREWALPWLSYIITSVEQGQALESRAWRLKDDRSGFEEESLEPHEIAKNSS